MEFVSERFLENGYFLDTKATVKITRQTINKMKDCFCDRYRGYSSKCNSCPMYVLYQKMPNCAFTMVADTMWAYEENRMPHCR